MVSIVSPTVVRFPAASFRRVASPYDAIGQKSYVAVANAFDLPDVSDWRDINVRDAKTTGTVPREIRKTLDENPRMFLFMNRGLVVTTQSASFDPQTGLVSMVMADPRLHGLLDGGHTYNVVQAYCSEADRANILVGDEPLVRIEILEGFGPDDIVDIVEARNTSNQVKEQSLLELQGAFKGIHAALEGQAYAKLVAYKEYEVFAGDNSIIAKPIDIREIVSILTAMNKDLFGDNAHPIIAYSQKAECLKRFKDNGPSYQKLYPLLPEILRLWDLIHLNMRRWYESAKMNKGEGAKFGKITGIQANKATKLFFLDTIAEDAIPTAFKYPILAALRAFLEEQNGRFVWGKGLDPAMALKDGLGEQLTEVVMSNAMEFRNPTKQGKTASVWDQCYSKAQISYLKA